MAVGDAHVFPGFLTPVLTQLFFPKPPTTFLTCFCRGERRKYAGKKSRLNRGSYSQPPGHESDTLTTEPPGWGDNFKDEFRNEVIGRLSMFNDITENIDTKSRDSVNEALDEFTKVIRQVTDPLFSRSYFYSTSNEFIE